MRSSMKKTKVSSYVEVKDAPLQKLSIGNQLRYLMHKLTYDPRVELEAISAETKYELQLEANLRELIHKATEPIRKGVHKKVALDVSSKFKPVLDKVLSSKSISNFYEIQAYDRKIDYNIDYFIRIVLTVKER